jgi:DNA-directed RNA polymerase subunit RPC12/RpoP
MALSFKCEFCGKDIVVRYLKIGEQARCRHCGKYVAVPKEATEIELSPDEGQPTITTARSISPREIESVTITNPGTGIWFYPREAIRLALTADRQKTAIALAAIYGIVYNLHLLWRYGAGAYQDLPLWAIVGAYILFGAWFGWGLLDLSSRIVSWASRLLGGLKSVKSARIALGWSCIPYVALLVIIPLIFIEPNTFVFHPKGEMFTSDLSRIYFGLRSIMTIWFLVIMVAAVSEALELSISRTIIVLLTLSILLVLVTFLLVMLYAALSL